MNIIYELMLEIPSKSPFHLLCSSHAHTTPFLVAVAVALDTLQPAIVRFGQLHALDVSDDLRAKTLAEQKGRRRYA
jgi:hypothetical protein